MECLQILSSLHSSGARDRDCEPKFAEELKEERAEPPVIDRATSESRGKLNSWFSDTAKLLTWLSGVPLSTEEPLQTLSTIKNGYKQLIPSNNLS